MSNVSDIKSRSVGMIVEMVYETMTPAEKNTFDGACERFQMRPATMIRRQINTIIERVPDIDIGSRTALLKASRDRQYNGLSVLINNISAWELLMLMDAIRRANETIDADK